MAGDNDEKRTRRRPNLVILHKAQRAADESGYDATDEQVAFRDVVATAVDDGCTDVAEWCRRYHETHGRYLTPRTVQRWQEDPSFIEWFMSALPQPMSPAEVRLSNAMIERALAAKAAAGDSQAVGPLLRLRMGEQPHSRRTNSPAPPPSGVPQAREAALAALRRNGGK
jgi:hypothetical protein